MTQQRLCPVRPVPCRSLALGLLLTFGCTLAAAGWAAPAADATAPTAFTLTARSDVATVEYYRSDVPVIPPRPVLFHSPSTAQARLDSLGTSQALASAPEPGPFVRELPEETAGVTDGQVEPPSYPMAARSSSPTDPEERVEAGTYVLEATSDAQSSTASAQSALAVEGGTPSRSRADATVRADDAKPRVATADVWLDVVAVRDVLRISDVRSRARLEIDAGGSPSTGTSTTIGAVSVNGVAVALDEDGIAAPEGATLPVDVETLASQLRAAGIELRYLPAVEDEGSVRSAAVEISLTDQDPTGATHEVVLTLGRVSVTGDASATSPLAPPTVPEVTSTVQRTDDAAGAPPPAPPPDDPPDAAGTPTLDAVEGGPAPVDPAPVASAPAVAPPASGPAAGAWRDVGYTSFFLTLTLAAVTTGVFSRLLGLLGVRLGLDRAFLLPR